jgi:hypothetical protein
MIVKQKDKLNTTQKTNTMSNTNPTIIKQKDRDDCLSVDGNGER